jgi:putative ABC transport system substrate-binding protein
VDRRAFIGTLAGGLLAAPLAAQGQQAGKVYRVGVLGVDPYAIDALKDDLADLGHREGQNFVLEQPKFKGRFERLPAAVDSLVKVPVDVIVVGGSEYVQPVMNATRTIPVVFTNVGDPVGLGYIASYAKPGRNITGITNMTTELTGKWLELLKQVNPGMTRVAVLWNPPQPAHTSLLRTLEASAVSLQLQTRPVIVRRAEDWEGAFAAIRRERVGGLTMLGSLVTFRGLRQIAEFAQQARLPAVAWTKAFPQLGGLISYGVDERNQWRRAAAYVDRILNGANPADLPVEQPTKFELVLNLKTAKALGLTIPPSLLQRADQVIE